MLNPFPDLLAFGFLLGPLLLRIALSGILLRTALFHAGLGKAAGVTVRRFLSLKSVTFLIPALLFLIGLYTQLAAIAACLLFVFLGFVAPKDGSPALGRTTYAALALMSISLLFFGAGGFALDVHL